MHPKRFRGPSAILALCLNLSGVLQVQAYWPPLQDIQTTWKASAFESKIYDPKLQQWKTVSDSYKAGFFTNGVLGYIDTSQKAKWNTYDPNLAQWVGGDSWPDSATLILNNGGVIAFVTFPGYVLNWRTYDPERKQWMGGNSWPTHTGVGRLIFNVDSILAYTDENSRLYWTIYDPQKKIWMPNSYLFGAVTSYSVTNHTVRYTTSNGDTQTSGYDHGRGSWYSGPTRPLAYFSADKNSGSPPLWVWFTDMSIGATSWKWTFGDGGISNERSPYHVFTSPGLFTVTLSVTGPAGSSTTSTNIKTDFVGPAGTITINGGASSTASRSASLTLSASDNSGSVGFMQFSSDRSNWSAWEPYSSGKAWTLTAGDGTKTVFVQFKDATGNVSANASDTILLDTTAPSGSILINSGAATTSFHSVALALAAQDDGSGVAQMRLSHDGVAWNGWESFASSKSWNLLSGEGARSVFAQYKDNVGNVSQSFSDSIIAFSDSLPPSVTKQPQGVTTQAGFTVVFTVTASGTPPLSYQWLKDQTNRIAGAVSSSYNIANVQASHAGIYSVIVSNSFGSVTSSNAVLMLTDAPSEPGLYMFTTLAGLGGISGSADGPASAARFNEPAGLAVDGAGNVFVADLANRTIRKITPAGVVSTFAGSAGQSGSADGIGSAARFGAPAGVAFDRLGNLYVSDVIDHTIRKIAPNAAVTTLAGSPGRAGSADGIGSAAQFKFPRAMVVDSFGNIFVADAFNHTVRKITSAGVVSTLAGSAGQSGSFDGTGAAARFNTPHGIALDSAGNLFVPEMNSHIIRKISPGGSVTTFAGSAGQGGSADGTGTAARFLTPSGAAFDSADNLYITDGGNHTIRKITPAGIVTTIGGLAGNSGSADGPGSTARFYGPPSVAVDAAGHLYIADYSNHTIRKGAPMSKTICVQSPPGMVAWWSGDGNADDIAGSHNGTLQGVTSFAPGKVAAAYSFNGVDSFVSVADSPALKPSAFTIAGWFHFTALPKDPFGAVLASKYDGNWHGWVLQLSGKSTLGIQVIQQTGVQATPFVSTTVSLNTWIHLAGTYDGTTARLFIDGALAESEALPGGYTPTSVPLTLGKASWFEGAYMTGVADEVSFFNRALSEIEIQSIYRADSAGVCKEATPLITAHPQSLTACAGSTATFQVLAAGAMPLGYQWRKNGTNLSGATNTSFSLPDIQAGSGGDFTVVVSNASGSATSQVARLTINAPPTISIFGPIYVTQPSKTAPVGGEVIFDVMATGSPPLWYRWFRDGTLLTGATNSTLTLRNVQMADAGKYWAQVSNDCGAVTNQPVLLTVTPGSGSGLYTFATLAGVARSGGADGFGKFARFYEPRGIAVDPAGNVYVADSGNGTVRKIAPDGFVSTLAGTAGEWGFNDGSGRTARFSTPEGIAIDPSGNLYVADFQNSIIRKITPAGEVTTWAGRKGSTGSTDGVGSEARFNRPEAVAVDNAGNVYVADTDNHTIRKISPLGIVTTLAGLTGTIGSRDGLGNEARFNTPRGIAVDKSGHVYVADCNNEAIRKITPAGLVTTLAGRESFSGSTDGPGNVARFYNPNGLAVDNAGNLYVADSFNSTIRKVTPDGIVTTLAGLVEKPGSTDGPISLAQFNYPRAAAVDSAGNVYVADTLNDTVRKITPDGIVSTLAGFGDGSGSTDGAVGEARVYGPERIAVDREGNVYVADSLNSCVRKITPSGLVTTLAGVAGTRGSLDGVGSNARFSHPSGIAVDSSGIVYVADSGDSTIRKVSARGEATTLAGLPRSEGSADGAGSAARFNEPKGVAVDGAGYLYVADRRNQTIRKITPQGIVTTLAGLAGVSGSSDGLASAARFNFPAGVAVDSTGHVYVADTFNQLIRKITPAGLVSTIAGMEREFGGMDGIGKSARFSDPASIALDSTGNLYVIESYNNTIRKITSAGEVSRLAGWPTSTGSADGTGDAVRFNRPEGIAMDTEGKLYVADTRNNTIRIGVPSTVVNPSVVVTLAGSGSVGAEDGRGTNASFNSPNAGSVGADQFSYVADSFNHRIRRVDPLTGDVTTMAGAGLLGFQDGPAKEALFNYPIATAVNALGEIFVADSQNHRIRKIGRDAARTVTTIAGSGTAGYTDGPAQSARFNFPNDLVLDAVGNLFVSEFNNHTIRRIAPDGAVSTFVGNGISGTVDGMGASARLNSPGGLAIDKFNHIYVTEWNGHCIRKITPSGAVTTLAGNAGISGFVDGLGSAARFKEPDGIVVDPVGNLYVTEHGNHAIRKVTPQGEVTTVAGTGTAGSLDGDKSVAQFRGPGGISWSNSGNLVVADTGNHKVRLVRLLLIPQIVSSPQSQTTPASGQARFGVSVTGPGPMNYQWALNRAPIPNATNAIFTLSNVQTRDAGNYTVAVSNARGSSASSNATLTVTGPPPGNRVLVLGQVSGSPGAVVKLPVDLTSQGDENTVAFSVSWDPASLSFDSVGPGTSLPAGTSLVPNTSAAGSGRLGVLLALPAGQKLRAGPLQLATISLRIVTQASGEAKVVFNDQPVAREIVGPEANVLLAAYRDGIISVLTGLEADLSPRPEGDQKLTAADHTLLGRIVLGSIPLSELTETEFIRADCAPRSTLGDGRITAVDWTQSARYVVGLDAAPAAGGPGRAAVASAGSLSLRKAVGAERAVRAGLPERVGSGLVSVPVELRARGGENTVAFSLQFDPRQLSYQESVMGALPAGTTWMLNAERARQGKLGLMLALPAGEALSPQRYDLARVILRVTRPTPEGPRIGFGDEPVTRELVSANAQVLPAQFVAAADRLGGEGPGLGLTRESSGLAFSLTGRVGQTYQIEFSPELHLGRWTTVGRVTLRSSPQKWVDSTVPRPAQGFYRLVEISEP